MHFRQSPVPAKSKNSSTKDKTAVPNLKCSGFVLKLAQSNQFTTYKQNEVPLFFDERGLVKRHMAGLTSIYSSVIILIGMNELRFASVLHTFDASKV